jgi:hypothetical protein
LPPERIRCKYSSFSDFLTTLKVLSSSGVEVVTIHDDFATYCGGDEATQQETAC